MTRLTLVSATEHGGAGVHDAFMLARRDNSSGDNLHTNTDTWVFFVLGEYPMRAGEMYLVLTRTAVYLTVVFPKLNFGDESGKVVGQSYMSTDLHAAIVDLVEHRAALEDRLYRELEKAGFAVQ